MKNYAYVTLLTTDEFINGVVVLYNSWLKTKSKYPFYCIVTNDLSKKNIDILNFMGINLIFKEKIEMPDEMIKYNIKHLKKCANWYQTFTKFYIFELEQFDKIVYLDCDIYIMKNIDEMFEYPHMSGVVDCAGLNDTGTADYITVGDNYFKYFNSGVLVIEPSRRLFEDIINFINSIKVTQILADQILLSMYYKDWKDLSHLHLSVYYNVLVPVIESYIKLSWFNTNNIKILHFVGVKPWQKEQKILNSLEKQYMNFLNGCIKELKQKGYSSVNLISL